MCDPISLTLAAVSAGATIVGAQQQARAIEQQAEATGRSLATQAGQEQDAANAEAEKIRKAARAAQGDAIAAVSASGVSAMDGSPLRIVEKIGRDGELDALNAIITGNRRASSLTDQATQVGRAAKAQAKATRTAGITSVLSQAAGGMTAAGWRSNGPGFSGTQAMAPVETARPVFINR